MTEVVAIRRSFRLKAVIETNKKYDDIFSSVVTNAFLMDVQMTPDEYFAEKSAQMLSSPSSKTLRGPRGPYKKRPKPTQNQLDAKLSQIQREIGKVSSTRRSEKQPIQKIEKITKSLARIVKNIEDSDDIVFLPTPPKTFPCSCGKIFDKHDECHRHMYEEHYDNDPVMAECLHCGHHLEGVRVKHCCHICNKFHNDLESHLKVHYQNCTGKGQVMECRLCPRQFRTVKEVMQHEYEKHTTKAPRRLPFIHNCNECSAVFNTGEALMDHYGNHVDVNLLAQKITELQTKVDATNDECPFCRSNHSSRKGFRGHLYRHHWTACKSVLRMDLSVIQTDREIKQEIDELTRHVAEIEKREEAELRMKEVKQEVKEEIRDDGYPIC